MTLRGRVSKTRLYLHDGSEITADVIDKRRYDMLDKKEKGLYKEINEDIIDGQYFIDEDGKKQGFARRFGFGVSSVRSEGKLTPREEEVMTVGDFMIFRWPVWEGEYGDDRKEGVWVMDDCGLGPQGYVTYKAGKEHGISYLDGLYSLWRDGKEVKGNEQLRREWADIVDGLKLEKEMDKAGRSATLEKVLRAGTKEGKKEVLKEFHSKTGSMGVKRRTALKFDR